MAQKSQMRLFEIFTLTFATTIADPLCIKGFSLANNTTQTMYQVFSMDPKRGKKFARAMSANSNTKGYESHLLLNGYPWEAIGKGVVVDLGGSQGSVAISIAERFPHLSCIVQDLPKVVEQGQAALPKELAGRVSFMAQYAHLDPRKFWLMDA